MKIAYFPMREENNQKQTILRGAYLYRGGVVDRRTKDEIIFGYLPDSFGPNLEKLISTVEGHKSKLIPTLGKVEFEENDIEGWEVRTISVQYRALMMLKQLLEYDIDKNFEWYDT